MCRCLYTVLLATVLSLVARPSRAEESPAAHGLEPHEAVVDQRVALDLQVRDAQTKRGEQSLVGPVVLVSVGPTLLLGTMGGLALRGFAAGFDENGGDGGGPGLFGIPIFLGCAMTVGGIIWLRHVRRQRRVYDQTIRELTLRRRQLDVPSVSFAPLLSRYVQGASFALRF